MRMAMKAWKMGHGGTWLDHVEGMNMAVRGSVPIEGETRGSTQCDSQLASLHL